MSCLKAWVGTLIVPFDTEKQTEAKAKELSMNQSPTKSADLRKQPIIDARPADS